MASYGYTFNSGDGVTPTRINAARTISDIVNADVSASAAIDLSKLATGALPTAITVASANIVDGTIVNADISATANISGSKLADGAVVQVVQKTDGVRQVISTSIPFDNTTPQSTEGTEILSQSITPQSSTNKILARCVIPFDSGSGYTAIFALFRGTTCIAATVVAPTNGEYGQNATIEFLDSPATTSQQTYSVRAGISPAGESAGNTVRVSGIGSLSLFNGALVRTLTLMEVKAS